MKTIQFIAGIIGKRVYAIKTEVYPDKSYTDHVYVLVNGTFFEIKDRPTYRRNTCKDLRLHYNDTTMFPFDTPLYIIEDNVYNAIVETTQKLPLR